jgi:hypothetical protein
VFVFLEDACFDHPVELVERDSAQRSRPEKLLDVGIDDAAHTPMIFPSPWNRACLMRAAPHTGAGPPAKR